jgi:hypothetical protein
MRARTVSAAIENEHWRLPFRDDPTRLSHARSNGTRTASGRPARFDAITIRRRWQSVCLIVRVERVALQSTR